MRWVGAFIGALLILFVGGSCVRYVTGFILDPFWEAPLEE
jgi:hypothetical protein